MRSRTIAIAILLAMSLGIASCSTGAHGSGHLAGVASPAASAPGLPTAGPTGTEAAQGAGGTPTKASGNGSGGSTSPKPKPGAPKITGTIDPIAGYSGTNCPYTTVATGTVSVDHGPISLRVVWSPNYEIRLRSVLLLDFPGKGPQSAKVSFTLRPPPDDANVSVALDVNEATTVIPLATAGFTLTCKAAVSRPTVSEARGACPYAAVWTSTITMSYAVDNVTYEWDASNAGKIGGGTLDFAKPGSKTLSSPPVTVLTKKVGTDFVVSLKVTSPAGGSNGSAARCTSIPAQ
jgi:hypothetical protein